MDYRPVVTESMMLTIKKMRSKTTSFSSQCDTCGDKLGAYRCGSCGESCCKKHDDMKKRQFIHTHFPPSYWRKCAELDHVDEHPMVFGNEVALFDHITSNHVKKCAESRCRAKQYCPACKIDLQFAYCVDCVVVSGSTIERTNHYCQHCLDDGKLVDYGNTKRKRMPGVQKNPFEKTNDGVFQLLCQYHAY